MARALNALSTLILTIFFFTITHHYSYYKDDDQKEYQKALSENVQKRMEASLAEMKQRHENGTNNQVDDPDRAPTGEPYRQMQRLSQVKQEEKRQQEACRAQEQVQRLQQAKENLLHNNNREESDEDSDDDWLLEDEGANQALESIRQARLAQLKKEQVQRNENVAKGHGQYRTISQDEFLPECTSSEKVVVHFAHDEFERCKIMDFHLQKIAPQHMECKFVRILANKAPFFVAKLSVKTLPTLLVFENGKTITRLTGFESLALDANKPDEWHTGRLQEWLNEQGAIQYTKPTEEVEEEMKRLGLTPRGAIWRGGVKGYDEDDE